MSEKVTVFDRSRSKRVTVKIPDKVGRLRVAALYKYVAEEIKEPIECFALTTQGRVIPKDEANRMRCEALGVLDASVVELLRSTLAPSPAAEVNSALTVVRTASTGSATQGTPEPSLLQHEARGSSSEKQLPGGGGDSPSHVTHDERGKGAVTPSGIRRFLSPVRLVSAPGAANGVMQRMAANMEQVTSRIMTKQQGLEVESIAASVSPPPRTPTDKKREAPESRTGPLRNAAKVPAARRLSLGGSPATRPVVSAPRELTSPVAQRRGLSSAASPASTTAGTPQRRLSQGRTIRGSSPLVASARRTNSTSPNRRPPTPVQVRRLPQPSGNAAAAESKRKALAAQLDGLDRQLSLLAMSEKHRNETAVVRKDVEIMKQWLDYTESHAASLSRSAATSSEQLLESRAKAEALQKEVDATQVRLKRLLSDYPIFLSIMRRVATAMSCLTEPYSLVEAGQERWLSEGMGKDSKGNATASSATVGRRLLDSYLAEETEYETHYVDVMQSASETLSAYDALAAKERVIAAEVKSVKERQHSTSDDEIKEEVRTLREEHEAEMRRLQIERTLLLQKVREGRYHMKRHGVNVEEEAESAVNVRCDVGCDVAEQHAVVVEHPKIMQHGDTSSVSFHCSHREPSPTPSTLCPTEAESTVAADAAVGEELARDLEKANEKCSAARSAYAALIHAQQEGNREYHRARLGLERTLAQEKHRARRLESEQERSINVLSLLQQRIDGMVPGGQAAPNHLPTKGLGSLHSQPLRDKTRRPSLRFQAAERTFQFLTHKITPTDDAVQAPHMVSQGRSLDDVRSPTQATVSRQEAHAQSFAHLFEWESSAGNGEQQD